MKKQLLLIEDVEGLGRSGDVVTARRGFIRNFLLPRKKALVATQETLKLQDKLKEERAKKAVVDTKEAEELAAKLVGFTLSIDVKVDPEGHMYGSVSPLEISRLLQEKGYEIEKTYIQLNHPIREVGTHKIALKLKEGVMSSVTVEVQPEGGVQEPLS